MKNTCLPNLKNTSILNHYVFNISVCLFHNSTIIFFLLKNNKKYDFFIFLFLLKMRVTDTSMSTYIPIGYGYGC